MANVKINSVTGLNDLALEMKSKVASSLTNDVNSLKETLNSINNYSNNGFSANVGDIASSIRSNLESGFVDTNNSSENLFNYASYINKFNVDDYDSSAKAIDLNAQYDSYYSSSGKKSSSSSGSYSYDDEDVTDTVDIETLISSIAGTTIVTSSSMKPSSKSIDKENNPNASNKNFQDLLSQVVYDNEGLATFGERYVISAPANYGTIGDLIDINQSDGLTLKCIIGDINTGTEINFISNKDTNVQELHPNWLQSIVSVKNKGNYFNYVK